MTGQKILNDALVSFAKEGNLEQIKFLVEEGADIVKQLNKILLASVENHHLHIIEYLWENNFDIFCYQQNAFTMACLEGQLSFVQFFVEKGANLYVNQARAFIWAVQGGHLEVVKYLMEKEFDLSHKEHFSLKTCIFYEKKDVFEYLYSCYKDKTLANNIVYETGNEFYIKYIQSKTFQEKLISQLNEKEKLMLKKSKI